MKITTQDFINAFFNPDDIVNVRVFEDKKKGIFKGAKIPVPAAKFDTITDQLKKHNEIDHGVFMVINSGGDDDASITRINAQFVEMDNASFEEQRKLIDAFPLPPSIINKTYKSLHAYYLVHDGDVSKFRSIQLGLVKHFDGDPMCQNESRCMRLPGFYHRKYDTPVMVETIEYHPERRYSQQEIIDALGDDYTEIAPQIQKERPVGTEPGLALVRHRCAFIRHCETDAANLSEHDWYALITNLASFEGGTEAIHEISAPYPNYKTSETDAKIDHFLNSKTGPITCRVIAEKGYKCPLLESGECKCKAPAAKVHEEVPVDELTSIIAALPVSGNVLTDMQTAQRFVSDFLFNANNVTAETVIKYSLKERFRFSTADMKPIIDLYKRTSKNYMVTARQAVQKTQAQGLPPWYEMTDKGPKFMPDILADYCREKKDVFYAAEQFYSYDNGVYKTMNEDTAKNMVRDLMVRGCTKLSQITDAAGQWKMQIQKDSKDLNTNPYLINLRNGMYDVLEEKLIEHSSKYLTTVQLNVSFTPGADCPRFKKFLSEQLDADQIPLVQEILGYFLIPTNRSQKSFLIVGEAAAGKSVLLRVINEILLGRENVSNVSWQALNERFKPAELFGKLANIFADLPTKNIDDNGIFKALVGEDWLTVERKNKNPFSFQSYARLLFSCNTIPRNYGDKSEGFYRRLIIIRFNHAVPEGKRDPKLIDKFQAEADGIFLFALEGLKRLMENGWIFSETESNRNEVQKYREDSNSVLAFINECCVIETGAEVGRTIVFDSYKKYCEECGLNPYSQRRFNDEVKANFPMIQEAKDKTGKQRTWRNMNLTDWDD